MRDKKPGSDEKMSGEEIAKFYQRVHRTALAGNSEDRLSPVIHPGGSRYVNSFSDFAHRLGMNNAFKYIESRHKSLQNWSVLDLGCGRGRWCREYAARGANVTGVDISPEAIQLLAEEMPTHRFLCQNIMELSFPDATFDIVNSVTVLQHLPAVEHLAALSSVEKCLRHGGYLVLLENITDFKARFVFPHSSQEWMSLAGKTGLQSCAQWDSNYEVLFRWLAALAGFTTDRSGPQTNGEPSNPRSLRHKFRRAIDAPAALLSFPLEWCCHKVQIASPTHSVMIFQKPIS